MRRGFTFFLINPFSMTTLFAVFIISKNLFFFNSYWIPFQKLFFYCFLLDTIIIFNIDRYYSRKRTLSEPHNKKSHLNLKQSFFLLYLKIGWDFGISTNLRASRKFIIPCLNKDSDLIIHHEWHWLSLFFCILLWLLFDILHTTLIDSQ